MSWSLIGGVVSSGALFLQSILAGRVLGPTEFGHFALTQSLLMVLLIFCLCGFDMAVARALPIAASEDERRALTSTATAATVVLSTVVTAVLLGAAPWLARLLSVDASLILASGALVVLFAQRWLMERELAGTFQFRRQAAARTCEVLANIGTFAVLVAVFDWRSYLALVTSYCVGALALALVGWTGGKIRVRVGSVRMSALRSLAPYVKLMGLQYIFFTLLSQLDKFVVNEQLGSTQLGIYQAYYAGTIFIVQQVVLLSGNVVYPMLSDQPDKRPFVRLLVRWSGPLYALGLVGLVVSGWLVLAVFGAQYTRDVQLLVTFAAWGALLGINGTAAYIIYAHSARAAAQEIWFQLARFLGLIVGFTALIELGAFSMRTAVLLLIAGEVAESLNLTRVIRTYVLGMPADTEHAIMVPAPGEP